MKHAIILDAQKEELDFFFGDIDEEFIEDGQKCWRIRTPKEYVENFKYLVVTDNDIDQFITNVKFVIKTYKIIIK